MRYSDADLRRLAASGAPLHQRWQGGIEPLSGDSDPSVQLQRWLHALSFEGEAEILVRRLAFDQLEIESCLPLLGSVRLADHEPLPAWVEWLDVVLLRYRSPQGVQPASTPLRANDACPSDTDGLLAHQDAWAYSIADQAVESIPFWEVWVPFVTQATEELRSRGNYLLNNLAKDALLTKDALQDFQLHLLTNLAQVAALPLSLEYRRFLARQDPLSILRTPTLSSPPSVDLYKQYIRSLQRGGLPTLLQEYPTLARLTAGITGHWTDHVAEFCERLREDKAALADLFNRDSDLGPVIRVRLGLSDPHHGRREVVIPTFARGLTVVYKPKDLGIDQAIWGFIDWFNTEARGDEHLRLRTLKVLNRTTHGWVEFIEHEACRDSHEARRYYQRTGMLLCVAYVLGGTDFHQENIIANGEHPVLLDLETMLQPSLRRWSGFSTDSADNRALEIMQRSVLCTGLLPFWIVGNADKSYDVSGIGSEPSDTGYLNAELENINTDRMQVVQRSLKTEPQANRPTLNGALLSAEHYLTDLIGGFATMYRILLAHRDVLLSEDGLMSRFSGLRLRYLMRMTKAYGQLLNRRLHPEFLRESTDSGIELERLARDFLVIHPDDDYPPPWGIYRAEVDALERLDIPFFSFFSDSNALISEGRIVAPGIFSETGLQRAFTCLNRLTEEDLQSQTDFIRASLHTRYNRRRSEVVQPPADDCTIEDIIQPPLSRVEFIAAAAAIAWPDRTCRHPWRGRQRHLVVVGLQSCGRPDKPLAHVR